MEGLDSLSIHGGPNQIQYKFSSIQRIYAKLKIFNECLSIFHRNDTRRRGHDCFKVRKLTLILLICFACIIKAKNVESWPIVYPTGLTIYNKDMAYEGYTCFLAMDSGGVYCIGMDGSIKQSWDTSEISLPELVNILPNGNLLVGRSPLKEYNWRGEEIWSLNDDNLSHDFSRLENGNTLVVSTERVLVPDISEKELSDDIIYEVTRAKEIVWTWRSRDHYNELGLSETTESQISETGGNYLGMNSMQPLPNNPNGSDVRFTPGNIIISYRQISTMIIIDKSSGDVLWKLGPEDFEDFDQAIGQHHAHMIPEGLEGEGNILLYDNGYTDGYEVENRYTSRVIEFNPVEMKKVWQFPIPREMSYQFFSYFISGAQRLPNGNTLITEGMNGRIFEVSKNGEIVWEFINPILNDVLSTGHGSMIYRAIRYPIDYFPYEFQQSNKDKVMNEELLKMREAVNIIIDANDIFK